MSMDIGGMSSLYSSGRKKSKPCPSKGVAEEIDREVLQEYIEEARESLEEATKAYMKVTTNISVDEPCCEEVHEDITTTCDAPMPQEVRTARMKVPRGIGRSIYDGPCGDSTTARAILEDWDMHGIRLAGRIYEDKRGQYPDGKMIYTDTVKSDISDLKEGVIIRTRSNYYLLGKRHVPNEE